MQCAVGLSSTKALLQGPSGAVQSSVLPRLCCGAEAVLYGRVCPGSVCVCVSVCLCEVCVNAQSQTKVWVLYETLTLRASEEHKSNYVLPLALSWCLGHPNPAYSFSHYGMASSPSQYSFSRLARVQNVGLVPNLAHQLPEHCFPLTGLLCHCAGKFFAALTSAYSN